MPWNKESTLCGLKFFRMEAWRWWPNPKLYYRTLQTVFFDKLREAEDTALPAKMVDLYKFPTTTPAGVFSLNQKTYPLEKKKGPLLPQVKKTNNSQQAPFKKKDGKKNPCGSKTHAWIVCAPKTPNLPETFHQASWIPTTARSVQYRRHHREVPTDTLWPPASRRPPWRRWPAGARVVFLWRVGRVWGDGRKKNEW